MVPLSRPPQKTLHRTPALTHRLYQRVLTQDLSWPELWMSRWLSPWGANPKLSSASPESPDPENTRPPTSSGCQWLDRLRPLQQVRPWGSRGRGLPKPNRAESSLGWQGLMEARGAHGAPAELHTTTGHQRNPPSSASPSAFDPMAHGARGGGPLRPEGSPSRVPRFKSILGQAQGFPGQPVSMRLRPSSLSHRVGPHGTAHGQPHPARPRGSHWFIKVCCLPSVYVHIFGSCFSFPQHNQGSAGFWNLGPALALTLTSCPSWSLCLPSTPMTPFSCPILS